MSSRFRTASSVIALAAFVLVFFTLPIYATYAQEYVDSLTNDGSIKPGTGGATTHVNKPEFIPLVQIPGITDREANIEDYINGLYTLSITAASLLVVVKLIGAGAGYVMSDVVTSKEQSKKDIRNALIGLLIILAAVTILNEINPNLRRLDFLSGASGLNISGDNRTRGDTNALDADRRECESSKGPDGQPGVYTLMPVGGWKCIHKEQPKTSYNWEVTEVSILETARNYWCTDNCELLFVGTEDDKAEQEKICSDQGGTLGSRSFDFQQYNFCYKN